MSHERKDPVALWIIALATALPLLYVFSSGPMRSVAFRRHHVTHIPNGLGGFISTCEIDQGIWWPKVYAPVDWASEQSWGKPLQRYLTLFPIRPRREPP